MPAGPFPRWIRARAAAPEPTPRAAAAAWPPARAAVWPPHRPTRPRRISTKTPPRRRISRYSRTPGGEEGPRRRRRAPGFARRRLLAAARGGDGVGGGRGVGARVPPPPPARATRGHLLPRSDNTQFYIRMTNVILGVGVVGSGGSRRLPQGTPLKDHAGMCPSVDFCSCVEAGLCLYVHFCSCKNFLFTLIRSYYSHV